MQPRKEVYTKEGTEIFGAVRAFAYANVPGVALRTGFTPPQPDLSVIADGASAFLEVTQARADGAFMAELRSIEKRILNMVQSDDALRALTVTRRIELGFIALPRSSAIPPLVDAIAAWLTSHDWRTGDPPAPQSPDIAPYVGSATAFNAPEVERPIRAAWLVNERPLPDYVPIIFDAIEEKKRKSYNGSPLWLAVTAVHAFDALPAVKRARIDPGQFERIYITDGKDAVTVKRLSPILAH
jgi:hypothetical protein